MAVALARRLDPSSNSVVSFVNRLGMNSAQSYRFVNANEKVGLTTEQRRMNDFIGFAAYRQSRQLKQATRLVIHYYNDEIRMKAHRRHHSF
jgi:hypothetical protein